MRVVLMLLLFSLMLPARAVEDFDRQQILQRIQPIGQVRTETTATPAPAVAATPAVTKSASGKDLYEKYCVVCHDSGLAGAPKFRDESDWKTRLTGKKLDDLTQSAIKGLNAMPAKGTCMDCSEADITNAIQYMLPQ